MARKATGQIVERNGKAGRVFALRFRAYGERRYVTLGSAEDGWSRERAEQELRHVLADVERGIWRPQRSAPVTPPERIETFHEFASQWYAERESELRPYTQENYKWALSYHLIAYFGSMLLTDLTIEEIDKYKFAKKHEGKLSNNSINATLSRLSQILEQALEYGKIDRNPARGNRRRLKGEPPARPWIQPEQLLALLEAADRNSRPVYATLAGTGMRPGEVVALNWGDVSLATGTIRIRASKTNAGIRTVDLPAGLVEVLTELKARTPIIDSDAPVFITRRRSRQTKGNLQRQLKVAIREANSKLIKVGIEPMSIEVTPYSFRRTYSSLRAARWVDQNGVLQPGDDPIYIADQMGHTDPSFTFRVYQRAVKRRERLTGPHLEAFDRALEWARMGTNSELGMVVEDHQSPMASHKPA